MKANTSNTDIQESEGNRQLGDIRLGWMIILKCFLRFRLDAPGWKQGQGVGSCEHSNDIQVVSPLDVYFC